MSTTQPFIAFKVDELLALVKKRYPNWRGFSDPDFIKDEVTYKRAAAQKAHESLGEDALLNLLEQENYDDFITRLKRVAAGTNLLFQGVPKSGDLAILYAPDLNKRTFCEVMYDLLFGSGDSAQRLGTFRHYVQEQALPQKWAFPLYFLFVSHPDTDILLKPAGLDWFLEFVGATELVGTRTPEVYSIVKQLSQQLKEALQEYDPADMIDIQSFIWVAFHEARGELLTQSKKIEFTSLFAEFLNAYPSTQEGQYHLAAYNAMREEGRKNLSEIIASDASGEDITDQVLLRLLPYSDTASNRKAGAWTPIAPAITGNIKKWFENTGWVNPGDWPAIARAILHFVRRCTNDSEGLAEAASEFAASGYAKGLQSGMLTPILNAVHPDAFLLINNKPRAVINYFAGTDYGQSLTDYPSLNETGQQLIAEVSNKLHESGLDMREADIFDMFSHWLVAVKNYPFQKASYWKIAPGNNAWQWDECREGGFIAMGWGEMGDIAGLTYEEFEARRNQLMKEHPEWHWTKKGLLQLWKFAHIKQGDRIVANKGTAEVLGIGTVSGPYYFVPDLPHSHHLPVIWDDTTPRQVDMPGWRITVVQLDNGTFSAISKAPPMASPPPDPTPNVWLFQANPEQYNLAEDLKKMKEGDKDSWSVMAHWTKIRAGDIVLIWQSGKQSGLYSIGEILDSPYESEVTATPEQIVLQPFLKAPRRVDFKHTRILNPPIPRKVFGDHAILNSLPPNQGTNYGAPQCQDRFWALAFRFGVEGFPL